MAADLRLTDVPAALEKRVREDYPYWAEKFAQIVDKQGRLVPFHLKEGQLALDRQLEAQRAVGKPMRAFVLKARQLGFSTAIQGKLVHRCTLRERYDAVTVAQDKETGAKLYRMAETMYTNLEDDEWLKPALGQYSRRQFLHFTGGGMWQQGKSFPDSRYTVDTAGEFQAGRGGTYRAVHASEAAFWPRLEEKLVSLMAAVPEDPETLFVIESTANGFNAFKDRWDDAYEGRNDWIAFFWPWFKDAEYSRPFASEAEKERFIVGDSSISYAEKEPDLMKRHELTIEQLHWRRRTIANDYGGDIRYFHQEYPSTPEEAFIATGQKVFDPWKAAQLMVRTEQSDPRVTTLETPGPHIADLSAAATETLPTFTEGTIEVPTQTLWTPRERGIDPVEPKAPWRFWLDLDEQGLPIRNSEYVMGVDVSGGNTETTRESDYHAIEVIDHKSLRQVAEYRSRIDPDLLTMEILLAAIFFNQALVAIERTGSWGAPALRILSRDLHYPRLYSSVRIGGWNEPEDQRLGWDTNQRTKPLLLAGMAELLRTEEDGVRSRLLAGEIQTYTRTEKGTSEAEPGKFDDLLMAYMIAQQVARDEPLLGEYGVSPQAGGFVAAGGMGAYDPRYR